MVDGDLAPRAVVDDRGEQAQLPGGAADLAGEPHCAEVGLLVGDRDEFGGVGIESLGDGPQPAGSRRIIGGTQQRRCAGGCSRDGVEVGGIRRPEIGIRRERARCGAVAVAVAMSVMR